jgi:hypothetical protein
MTQRNKMRELHARFHGNKEQCVRAYVEAERRGEVVRRSNTYHMSAETYASGLFNEGVQRKRWIH